MVDRLLALVGVLVTIVLLLVGYRKTVGAKKERIRVANGELQDIILKRIVLEDYSPNVTDLRRVISGKSRDRLVRAGELLSEEELLNTIFTKVIENDLINPDQRKQITARLSSISAELEQKEAEEASPVPAERPSATELRKTTTGVLLALASSALAASVILVTSQAGLVTAFSVFSIGFLVVISIFALRSIKDKQEETTKEPSAGDAYRQFESGILRQLRGLRLEVRAGEGPGYDYALLRDGKKVLLELKTWGTRVPPMAMIRTAGTLSEAMQAEGASEGVVVTRKKVAVSPGVQLPNNVRVISADELNDYITELRR